MQQIERYGVIALVFLLVTIVAISFWGDSKSPGFWSRLTGKSQPKNEVAKVEPQLPPQIANNDLPLSNAAPLSTPQPIDALGAPQPLTSIDAPATGSSTLQPPESTVVLGAPPVNAGPGAPTMPNAPVTTNAPATTPVVVAPPPAAPVAAADYTVQRGDSLARIAKNRLGAESRWQEIAALNPSVNPKNLSVGQKLVMPTGATAFVPNETPRTEPRSTPKPKTTAKAAPAAADKPKSEKASGARVCTVQKGDTLRSIARRELGDERRWKEIAGLNPSIDPSKLAIGQRVKLPSKGGELIAAVPASSTTSSSSKPRVR